MDEYAKEGSGWQVVDIIGLVLGIGCLLTILWLFVFLFMNTFNHQQQISEPSPYTENILGR